MQKPSSSEYNPFSERYISLVPEAEEYFSLLDANTAETVQFFGSLSSELMNLRYKPGKWSLKEMLMHIIDTERVMSYRALVIARGDLEAVLPSMDQDVFARGVNVDNRSLEDLVEEFTIVRQATVKLLKNITGDQSVLKGNVFGYPATPRALAYIILGHVQHHLNIAREKYIENSML
jgi:hypothetical protein